MLRDIYFHESMADFVEVFHDDVAARIRETALLVFTPDAIVSQQVGDGLELLHRYGFAPMAAELTGLTRHAIRELWRRELSTPDTETANRLAICDLLMPFTESLVVLLGDQEPVTGLPAAERLNSHKGSGEPSQRRPGTLRAELNSPNNVFRLLHASDGPLEVVRELGILADRPRRLRMLRRLAAGRPLAAADVVEQATLSRAVVGARPLVVDEPLRRIRAQVARVAAATAPRGTRGAVHVFSSLLTELAAGREVHCHALLDAARDSGVALDSWDLIAVGALAMSSVDYEKA